MTIVRHIDHDVRWTGQVILSASLQAEVQARLACAQRTLVRRQAELVRLQAIRVQVRALERAPRTIVLPARNMVIQIPQAPELPE